MSSSPARKVLRSYVNNQENISNEATCTSSPTTTTKVTTAGVVSTTTGGTEGTGEVSGSSRGQPYATVSEQDRYDSRKVSSTSTSARIPVPATTTSYDKGIHNNIHHHVSVNTTSTTIGRDSSPTSSLSPPALSSPPSNDYNENLLHDENFQEGERGGGKGAEKEKEEEPQQPKAPRSAFICFSDAKKDDILARYGIDKKKNKDAVLKILAQEWRELSDRDRAYWDEEARNDKVRFVREKAAYKGPWKIPQRRAKKHPLAPRRPPSAFLKFSKTRRSMVKQDNPDMSNTDVSRLLGEMWRSASPKEREPYVQQEEKERAIYKEAIKKFREEQARLDAAHRTSHQSAVAVQQHQQQQQKTTLSMVDDYSHGIPPPPPPPASYHHHHHYPGVYELVGTSTSSASRSFESATIQLENSFEDIPPPPTKRSRGHHHQQHHHQSSSYGNGGGGGAPPYHHHHHLPPPPHHHREHLHYNSSSRAVGSGGVAPPPPPPAPHHHHHHHLSAGSDYYDSEPLSVSGGRVVVPPLPPILHHEEDDLVLGGYYAASGSTTNGGRGNTISSAGSSNGGGNNHHQYNDKLTASTSGYYSSRYL